MSSTIERAKDFTDTSRSCSVRGDALYECPLSAGSAGDGAASKHGCAVKLRFSVDRRRTASSAAAQIMSYLIDLPAHRSPQACRVLFRARLWSRRLVREPPSFRAIVLSWRLRRHAFDFDDREARYTDQKQLRSLRPSHNRSGGEADWLVRSACLRFFVGKQPLWRCGKPLRIRAQTRRCNID